MFRTEHITYSTKIRLRISKQTNQATKLLIVILVLFVIGQVPHGIYSTLSLYYGPKFFWMYYYKKMEIFNTITFITETFNFFVYYSMNSQFRRTFKELFFSSNNNERNNSEKSTQLSVASNTDITSQTPRDTIKINFTSTQNRY